MNRTLAAAVFALCLGPCQGCDAAARNQSEVGGCPANLDSASTRLPESLRECRDVYARHAADLVAIRVARSGYVSDTTMHVFDATGGRSGEALSEARPVTSLYEQLLRELCHGDGIPEERQSCLMLERAQFQGKTGLPTLVEVQCRTRPGVDCDGITSWRIDSIRWR